MTDNTTPDAPSRYMIREEGKNGEVEIWPDRIVRLRKKAFGKTDTQMIPVRNITAVHHDRRTLGTDEVQLQAGVVTYAWRVKNAEEMVAELHERMMGAGSQ